MQRVFTRNSTRPQSAPTGKNSKNATQDDKSELKTSRSDSYTTFRKRSINNTDVHERVVRFKSTTDEYEFDVETYDQSGLANASDVFKKILKDMRYGQGNNDSDDFGEFDGVFTATPVSDLSEKKGETRKQSMPRKSILKRERRISSSRR